jgi:hypothetical protein
MRANEFRMKRDFNSFKTSRKESERLRNLSMGLSLHLHRKAMQN